MSVEILAVVAIRPANRTTLSGTDFPAASEFSAEAETGRIVELAINALFR